MAAIFGETNFFENWHGYSADTLWFKNFIEIARNQSQRSLLYLAQFSKYKQFHILQFLRKIQKLKITAIFGETKLF